MTRPVARAAVLAMLVLNGCVAGTTSSTVDPTTLDVSDVALPSEFRRYNEATAAFEIRPQNWTAVATAAPQDSACGDGFLWAWQAVRAGESIGDPDIRFYLCTEATAEDARRMVGSLALEEAVVPHLGVYDTSSVNAVRPMAHADESRLACMWGVADECRAWAFAANFGRHVVYGQWMSAAVHGALDQTAFEGFMISIDQAIGNAIVEDAG